MKTLLRGLFGVYMLKKQKGFTLIELIIVITLLGILSIIALPRFLDIGTDARIAALEQMEVSMKAATNLVNIKAEIENKTDCSTDPVIEMGDNDITLRCGYPCPHPSGIANAVDYDEGFEWVGGNCGGQLGNIDVRLADAPDPANCKIRYVSARSTREPEIVKTISGC